MPGSEETRSPQDSGLSVAGFAPIIVAIAFFAAAVITAGFGKYVMSIVSLISGLAILSYVVEVSRHER